MSSAGSCGGRCFNVFIYDCASSLLLPGLSFSRGEWGLPQLWLQASHCSGSSSHGAQAPGSSGFRSCTRRLSGRGSRVPEHRLSGHDARALLHHSLWDLPGPGIELVSLALASRFFTTEPPGKPDAGFLTHRRDDCGKEEEKAQHISFQHQLGLTEVPASEHLNLVLGGKDQERGKLAYSNAEPIPVNSLTSHKSSWEEGKLAQPEPSDQHVLVQSQGHNEHTHVTYFQQGPSVCGFEVRNQLTVPRSVSAQTLYACVGAGSRLAGLKDSLWVSHMHQLVSV